MNYLTFFSNKKPLISALVLALLFSGCVEPETKVTTSGTGKSTTDKMVASGAITGLGPIQVSGTTLGEANTQTLLNAATNRTANDLRLGMTADITGTIINDSGLGDASFVLAQNAVRGRIAFIDSVNRIVGVQGVFIGFDQNTIFDGTNGELGGARVSTPTALRGLNIGDTVEVYGINNLTPALTASTLATLATRVLATRLTLLGESTNTNVELSGIVGTGVSTSSLFITLVGNIINVAGAQQLGVTNASTNVVATSTAIPAGSRIRVVGFVDPGIDEIIASQVITNITAKKTDDEIIVLDSIVTALLGATRVRLGDSEVELAATGIASTITPGARLQVRGRQIGGVVQATNARVIGRTERIEYVVDGTITELSGNTIRVRGERINIASAAFSGGTTANLSVGRAVVVRGVAGAGQLDALSITLR
jgi:Domain of unknown function (DUF5666)